MFGLQGPRWDLAGAALQPTRVVLVALLFLGSGLLVPHEDPESRAERMDGLRANARNDPHVAGGPSAPRLLLGLSGPTVGLDHADAWERVHEPRKGGYATRAELEGEGRLSGSLWLYPSVCAPCTLETHKGAPLEEWGLVGVQYSLSAREGAAWFALEGDVDWEVRFETFGLVTADPLGPPKARLSHPVTHWASASPPGAERASSHREQEILLEIEYEAVPLDGNFQPLSSGAIQRQAPYVLHIEESESGALLIERLPL